MAFDKRLLEILACPVSKGSLTLIELDGEQCLLCKYNRMVYPIKDNIPVLLEDEAKQISLEEMEEVLQ